MATPNPFDLLGDDDAEDPSLLLAAQQHKINSSKNALPSVKPPAGNQLPQSKPLPPVRESKSESARGGRGGARGRGRGSYRDSPQNDNSYGNRKFYVGQSASDDADAGKSNERRGGYGGPGGSVRGGRRGGFSNEDMGEGDRPRRPLDCRSGTGYGYESKRDGAGRGNWGTQTDEPVNVAEDVVTEGEKVADVERPSGEDIPAATDGDKEISRTDVEEKEPEEMTLEEYEKILEEKRKALQALNTDSRKVDVKEFESMQQLSNKKAAGDIFIKLGSEKDKKKELAEKEERAKKSVSINEFLKPADGEKFYNSGRGRGRGRGGPRGGGYGGGSETSTGRAPAIEDPGQFPTLGGK
ncbi:RGG repeats nuclear RNA binding protein A-like [Salvia divinorum]|uniref:RGG repeats nuclear RNA binding protein A-like n=1 Tax=Salvia divinorum TaxID=28513 RepID=A0ABD1GRY5_SALDI